jgi:hypothetical protein
VRARTSPPRRAASGAWRRGAFACSAASRARHSERAARKLRHGARRCARVHTRAFMSGAAMLQMGHLNLAWPAAPPLRSTTPAAPPPLLVVASAVFFLISACSVHSHAASAA